MTTQEQRWATAERSLEVQAARRIRRTPAVIIAITGLLVIAVASTAVVDLRRLHTPRGAALAWVVAATFGDCRAYLALSTPPRDARGDDDICAALRARTAPARRAIDSYQVRAVSVQQDGDHALVQLDVRTPSGTSRVTEELVRHDDGWRVVRPPTACTPDCY
ncbi:MAG: hypothetical protein ABR604_04305 [Jatrophihabitantaceae bacterium]